MSKKIFFLTILFVSCSAQIASDIYSPSISFIASSLKTSISMVQSSMAIYMFGLAVSQLFYGPLSEGLGRKNTLIIGLLIFLSGHFVSLFSPTIGVLIAGRFIQGCGAGACSALWRSIFRDTFEGAELAKYGSYFSILVTFMVPAAPAVGGYLQAYFGWRSNFIFLALYTICTLLMVCCLFKESNIHRHISKLNTTFIVNSYKELLFSPIFMGYTLCTFLCYGAFFSWFSVGPVLLIEHIGISPIHFGWITLFGGGIFTALSSWIYGRTVTPFGTHFMLRSGLTIMMISGALLILGKYFLGLTLWDIVLPLLLFYFGVTFIWPSVFANAFKPFGKTAGVAGAAYGFMQISGAATIGALVSYLPHQNQIPLGIIFIVCAALALIISIRIARKERDLFSENLS
jgi:Bcr/CflA subfamily drug resistance transporter